MSTNKAQEKMLITGGCGFIGSNLAAHFLDKGWEVVVYDNFARPSAELNAAWLEGRSNGNLSILRADVRDYVPLYKAMKGTSVVAHLAAQVFVHLEVELIAQVPRSPPVYPGSALLPYRRLLGDIQRRGDAPAAFRLGRPEGPTDDLEAEPRVRIVLDVAREALMEVLEWPTPKLS